MKERQLKTLLVDNRTSGDTHKLIAEIDAIDVQRVSMYDPVLAEIDCEEFDVCLIDHAPPKYNGLLLLRQAIERGCKIPFIFLITPTDIKTELEIIRAGAADCLIKGHFDGQTLKRAIFYAIERTQAVLVLREKEEQYRRLVESSPDAITVHVAGKVVYVNAAGVNLFGAKNAEQAIGKAALDFVHPDYKKIVQKRIQQSQDGRKETELLEEKFVTIDQRVIDVEVATQPVSYQGEKATQVVIRDITERKQAEEALRESEERYRVTFDHAPVGIVQIGTDGRWLWANKRLCHILGYSQEELQGITASDITFSADVNSEADHIRQMEMGNLSSHAREKRYVRKDGSIVWVNRTVSVVRNQSGRPQYYVGVIEDITQRKMLEKQLEKLLEQRARQVQTSTEVAQEIAAAPALDELFQRVVHLVQERFGYYHAHVYTLAPLNESREMYLIMQEGTGEAGRIMKKAGHKIRLAAEKSLVARAAQTGQPVLVSDVSQESGWLPNALLPATKSEIAVPIKLNDTVIGVLDVQSNIVGGVTEEDQLLLLGLCGQIAVAIDYGQTIAERQQAEAAAARRAEEMTALYQTALEINAELDVSTLLQGIVRRAASLTETQMGSLALVEPNENVLVVEAVHNRPESDLGVLIELGQGIAGRIAQTGESMRITDYQNWPGHMADVAKRSAIGCVLGVPLKQDNKIVGTLCVLDKEPGEFSDNAVQLLNLFATYAAIVIQNVRLFEAEQRQREIAEALSKIARAVNSSLELDEVLDRTLLELEGIIPYDAANILLIENENARMVTSRHFMGQEELMNKPLPLIDLPLSSKTISQKLPLLVTDTHEEPLFRPAVSGSVYARCLILVPLIIRDKVIAVLTIISYTPRRFSMDDVDIVSRFSQQVVIAIENARLYEQVQQYNVELEQRVARRTAQLKATQEALIHQEKLAILGQLAGGVAHELLNPLGVVNNAVYFLQLTLKNIDETTTEYLKIISDWVCEAEKIVSGLIEFSHSRPPVREEIAVIDLVGSVLKLHPPSESVTVTLQIDSKLPPVFIDPSQIGRQVLANLITNAYHAMPNGGNLTFAAQLEQGFVALSITDTGSGMSAETAQKIFEPLFSTKTHGIGLGLAISKNLVAVNGGKIEVESELGQGTTFTVILPTASVIHQNSN